MLLLITLKKFKFGNIKNPTKSFFFSPYTEKFSLWNNQVMNENMFPYLTQLSELRETGLAQSTEINVLNQNQNKKRRRVI